MLAMAQSPDTPFLRVLGHDVAAVSRQEALTMLSSRLAARDFTPVAFLNSHVANIAADDEAFDRLLDDFLILPDGIGIDIAAWMKYGRAFPDNLNGTDFIPFLLGNLPVPCHVGLIGARPEHLKGATTALSESFPRHRFTSFADGYSPSLQDGEVLGRLAEDRPDILLVAMGVPAQEEWIERGLDSRHCSLAFGVGALFDFLAGAVPRAPRLVRQLRSEWLWRLALEPRRLFRRYVIGNPRFLLRVLKDRKEV